jgi:hypothetical protein
MEPNQRNQFKQNRSKPNQQIVSIDPPNKTKNQLNSDDTKPNQTKPKSNKIKLNQMELKLKRPNQQNYPMTK